MAVGLGVGPVVGADDGDNVGWAVGFGTGDEDSKEEGAMLRNGVGSEVGAMVAIKLERILDVKFPVPTPTTLPDKVSV